MELTDLNHDEKLACIALFNLLVPVDGTGSEGEAAHVAHLADACGDDEYERLLDQVGERGQSEEDLKAMVAAVENPEARKLIHATVMACAFEDGLAPAESHLLSWLAHEWGIDV